jgi:glycogen(starch) synthase
MTEKEKRVRRVLIVSMDDPWKRGGVGGKHTHIRLLARGLKTAGVECDVVSAKETASFKFLHLAPGSARRRMMRTHDQRYMHYSEQYSKQLAKNLRKHTLDADVVNAHDAMAADAVLELMGERQVPLVLTMHGYYSREAASDGEIRTGSPEFMRIQEIERRAYRNAWRIVCVDSRIKDYVTSEFEIDPGLVSVLPNAIDTDGFSATTPSERKAARSKLRLPEDLKIVLCSRRMVPKNGVPFAVEAMKFVKTAQPETILVLAGDGPERGSVEQVIQSEHLENEIRLVGSVPHAQIADYYAASDIVLVPSIKSEGVEEATSLSMLEGMSCAKPVIVTNVGGLKETVKDGETGLVVQQSSPEAIADAIDKLLKDPALATRLGKAAREYVKTNHSYTNHATRMLAEYERAVREGPQNL